MGQILLDILPRQHQRARAPRFAEHLGVFLGDQAAFLHDLALDAERRGVDEDRIEAGVDGGFVTFPIKRAPEQQQGRPGGNGQSDPVVDGQPTATLEGLLGQEEPDQVLVPAAQFLIQFRVQETLPRDDRPPRRIHRFAEQLLPATFAQEPENHIVLS